MDKISKTLRNDFQSDMHRILGVYAFGQTVGVVFPDQVNNPFHESTVVHEHVHQSLTYGSTFGILQQLLACLTNQKIGSQHRQQFREMLNLTIDVCYELHEGIATFWQVLFIRQTRTEEDVKRFLKSKGNDYISAFEPIDSTLVLYKDSFFGFMLEMVALMLGQAAMNVDISSYVKAISTPSSIQFRELILKPENQPDRRFHRLLTSLTEPNLMELLNKHLVYHIAKKYGMNSKNGKKKFLSLSEKERDAFNSVFRNELFNWLSKNVTLDIFPSTSKGDIISQSFVKKVMNNFEVHGWSYLNGYDYSKNIPEIRENPTISDGIEYIPSPDLSVKFWAAKRTVTSEEFAVLINKHLVDTGLEKNLIHIGAPVSPTYKFALERLESKKEKDTILVAHPYSVNAGDKMIVFSPMPYFFKLSSETFYGDISALLESTASVCPYSVFSTIDDFCKFNKLFLHANLPTPLFYLPSSKLEYLKRFMQTISSGYRVEVSGSTDMKGIHTLYFYIKPLESIFFRPVPFINLYEFAQEYDIQKAPSYFRVPHIFERLAVATLHFNRFGF